MIFSLKSLFQKKPSKIEIFVRHCHYSAISQHKKRFPSFTRESAYENLLQTIDLEKANLTFVLDAFHPMEEKHFITRQSDFPVIEVKEGTETGSFLRLLDIVKERNFHPETIIYFLEDDYLHRSNWCDVLLEGFSLPADYVTLYDHRDKYDSSQYASLQSKIFHTNSCHWRTTPSTTNTYAMKYKTLEKHFEVHRAFSLNRTISADHEKFCKLAEEGAVLISSIPGWSTHTEPEFASPCIDWEPDFISNKF